MRKRTRAREIALQALYQLQVLGEKVCSDLGIFCIEERDNGIVIEHKFSSCDGGWRNAGARRYSDLGMPSSKKASDDAVAPYAEDLINGCRANQEAVDDAIKATAANWDLDRMALIDLAILRIGAYELLFREDIPPIVAIDEAIELGKKFGGAESGQFVNGILDKIRIRSKRS